MTGAVHRSCLVAGRCQATNLSNFWSTRSGTSANRTRLLSWPFGDTMQVTARLWHQPEWATCIPLFSVSPALQRGPPALKRPLVQRPPLTGRRAAQLVRLPLAAQQAVEEQVIPPAVAVTELTEGHLVDFVVDAANVGDEARHEALAFKAELLETRAAEMESFISFNILDVGARLIREQLAG